MKYAVVVHGRFFAFDLVRALLARKADVTLFTNYPKWAVRRFGIPSSRVKSFWLHGVASRLFERLQKIGLPVPEAALHKAFGTWAASRLRKSNADLVLSFSGVSEEAFKTLQNSDKILLLARCSTHIDVQNEIMQNERARSRQTLDGPSPWMILRERCEYKLADSVVVLSSFARQSFLNSNYPEDRLKLLPLGADLSHFRPSPEVVAERQRRISSGAPLRVLYVGTVTPRKGAVDLFEIVRSAAPSGRFEFCVVGPVDPQCQSLANNLSRYAKLIPKQPQSRLVEHYAWADLFIFPTLEDGYPVVLAQAQASALPIITTPNCSGPDMLDDGKTGWICPANDPDSMLRRLHWCDRQREELSDMVSNLYINHKIRDWSAVAEDFEALAVDTAKSKCQ